MVRHTKRKQEALLLHPNAETLDKAARLCQCEDEIRIGLHDFRRIGKALADIKSNNLFIRYKSFPEYCRQRWALARRTVYQKMQVYEAYHLLEMANEKISPDDLPTHEYQVRQLLTLPEAEQQVEAWQLATRLWKANHSNSEKMTAAVVKTAVEQVRAKYSKEFQDYLSADGVFGNIPWRLDVGLVDPNNGKFTLRLEPEPIIAQLLKNQVKTPPTKPLETPQTKPQLVLVNPGYDLFNKYHSHHDFLDKLLKLCVASNKYRFLVWTSSFRCVEQFKPWPSPVELIIRITSQYFLDAFTEYWMESATRPLCGLWIDPKKPIEIPRTISLTRLLIGSSGWQRLRSIDEIATLRRLVASVLTEYPVHMSASVCNALTKPLSEEMGD